MASYKHKYLVDLCKSKDLSTCGTKEVLYNRLVAKGILPNTSMSSLESLHEDNTSRAQYNYNKWTVIELKKECRGRGILQGNLLLKWSDIY